MTEFSLDWPHGWQTRNGAKKFHHIIGKMRDGTLVFETEHGGRTDRYPDGRCYKGEDDGNDIINAPAPKPEPRKIWVNAYLSNEGYLLADIGHTSRDKADSAAADVLPQCSTRIACVCITEGDGLEGEK